MSKLKIFFQIVLGFLFIIYSIETLIYLFLPTEQKNLIDINNTRIEIAKKRKINYDERNKYSVYVSESKKNQNLRTTFYFNKSFLETKIVKERLKDDKIVPFRGPINKQTISCAEDLKYKIINNDKYGFKNPNLIYQNNIDFILIGDSYAEGLCENEKNDISGHLRKSNLNSVNLGVTGSGPLLSLAILREFIQKLNPKYVVYLYFEGNDLNDLNWENQTYLSNYLDKNFKINYIQKIDELKIFLNNFHIEKDFEIKKIANNNEIIQNSKNTFLPILIDILEIKNIKSIFRSYIFNNNGNIEIDLFYDVLTLMNDEVKNNDSELIFIYLPTWSRYFTKFNNKKFFFDQKNLIIDFVKSNDIKFIDFANELESTKNLKEYFPLGYIGHYNSKGYKKIANMLENLIEN
tara:strand:- start:138 stop:1355 length:1218 start_codon:yes stop_codon:yes gene_type:complete